MITSKACKIYSVLFSVYGIIDTSDEFLHFENPYQILIATIISAQTTDKCVNKVTKDLFSKYSAASELANADPEEVENIIHSAGFFKNKAKNIIGTAGKLVSDFEGEVPKDINLLVTLPGVGRKTANIVMSHAFGLNSGIAVDTHVKRVSFRLGLTQSKNPEIIERDLCKIFPEKVWGEINTLFILHGRHVCKAVKPMCDSCPLSDFCNYYSEKS